MPMEPAQHLHKAYMHVGGKKDVVNRAIYLCSVQGHGHCSSLLVPKDCGGTVGRQRNDALRRSRRRGLSAHLFAASVARQPLHRIGLGRRQQHPQQWRTLLQCDLSPSCRSLVAWSCAKPTLEDPQSAPIQMVPRRRLHMAAAVDSAPNWAAVVSRLRSAASSAATSFSCHRLEPRQLPTTLSHVSACRSRLIIPQHAAKIQLCSLY